MPDVAFVISSGQHPPMRELAETLRHELAAQGVASTVHDGFPDPRYDLVYALVSPADVIAAHGPGALPGDAVLARTAFICDDRPEQLGDPGYLDVLRRAGAVFELDQRAVVALHRQGVGARLLRPGYSTAWDHFDARAPRPIEIMFLGTHTERRARYLSRAAPILARHNCLIALADGSPAVGDTSSWLADGRWPLLAQTAVVVNLHCGESDRLEWRRVVDAIHAGAVVVSEHSSGLAPLEAGEHLLMAGADALAFVAEALLADEARLATMRQAAYERLRSWYPFALSVAVLRAALLELLSHPVAPGAVATGATLAAALPPAVPAGPSESHGELQEIRRELIGTRHDLADVRRRLVGIQDAVRSTADAGPRVRVVARTGAWDARRAPAVSVLTAVCRETDAVLATLDSVAASRFEDLELVVVASGPGEACRATVARWLVDHPRVPAQLIVDSVDGGLGVARNTAVDIARGRSCLILDCGQVIHPRALEALTAALDSVGDNVVVAYPIQQRGDALSNYLAWRDADSEIRAPYLVDAQRLRDLGGFPPDADDSGSLDDALWRRIESRAWRGQLVAQILSRRAHCGQAEARLVRGDGAVTTSPRPSAESIEAT